MCDCIHSMSMNTKYENDGYCSLLKKIQATESEYKKKYVVA